MSSFNKNSPYGFPFRGYKSNSIYTTPYGVPTNTNIGAAATRLYYYPFPVLAATTFNRAYTFNQGTVDSGEKYRTGLYADDAAAGGPGTLILDFGEVTLTAAEALRTQTISLDLSSYVGQHVWFAFHNETSNMSIYTVQFPMAVATVGSGVLPAMFGPLFGSIGKVLNGADAFSPCKYVDTAYGALASTAVAPTTEITAAPLIALGNA